MKLRKRFAAMGAAMVMAVSMMSIGASAVTITVNNFHGYNLNCSATWPTYDSFQIGTSVSSQTTVGVSGSAKYYYNNKTYSTGNGNGGQYGTSATISKTGGYWTSLSTTHSVSSYSVPFENSTWKALLGY